MTEIPSNSPIMALYWILSIHLCSIIVHSRPLLSTNYPLKRCETPLRSSKEFSGPSWPPKWLIPLYSRPGLARTKSTHWHNWRWGLLSGGMQQQVPFVTFHTPLCMVRARHHMDALHTSLNRMWWKWKEWLWNQARGGIFLIYIFLLKDDFPPLLVI